MINRKRLKLVLAVVCFVFAGINLGELLQGPGNYSSFDLFMLAAFVLLGTLYAFLYFKGER